MAKHMEQKMLRAWQKRVTNECTRKARHDHLVTSTVQRMLTMVKSGMDNIRLDLQANDEV